MSDAPTPTKRNPDERTPSARTPTGPREPAGAPPRRPAGAPPRPAGAPPGRASKPTSADPAPLKGRPATRKAPRRARAPTRPNPSDITPIPPVPADHREIAMEEMIKGRSYVRVLFDEKDQVHVYEAIEPPLSDDEREVLTFVRDTLVRTLDGRGGRKGADAEEALLEATRQAVIDHQIKLSDVGIKRVEYHLVRDFLGYGPIDVLMRDGMIEDISCDGPGIPIYLFHREYESVRTNVAFEEEVDLDSFVIRLAQRSGKHISVADPILDATLPDGSRLQSTLSREVTTRGSSFTIRKFRADPLTPPDLMRFGTFSPEMAAYFWFAMEGGNSFILAGGTASGKTTSLNAVCQFIPPEKKIVSIEDTREINLSHENWIAGVTRSGFGAGQGKERAGSVDMYKLLEAALRQRPEYLLVGEVRGAEALTLFQAMATGHAVYSTMHADSVQSAVYRLENPPINVPRIMLQTLDVIIIQKQVRVGEHMSRRMAEVTEVVGYDPDTREILTNTVFEWDSREDKHVYLGKSHVLDQLMAMRNLPEEAIEKEWKQRVEVLSWMLKANIRDYKDVASTISSYYRNPAALLARIRQGASGAQ